MPYKLDKEMGSMYFVLPQSTDLYMTLTQKVQDEMAMPGEVWAVLIANNEECNLDKLGALHILPVGTTVIPISTIKLGFHRPE